MCPTWAQPLLEAVTHHLNMLTVSTVCTPCPVVHATCFLQSAKVVLSELRHINESEVIIRIGPLALLFVLLAQVLGLMWTLGGVWPDAA